MKILSVDDSAIIRKLMHGVVKALDYDFLEAEHGQEALEILSDSYQEVSLILLDWSMPVMNGLETLEKLKGDDRFKHIPVLMVTTEGERKYMLQALEMGSSGYIPKPFSPQDLLSKMVECLAL